ncbi:MAG TPA: FAD-dependent monooxygenase, partial [Pirellulales bacterium]|nr:FAD-dependent monooxygenase [Pirellulales bacterium]
MPTRVESDAVIVGAGPAGSTLAALLARDGWRVVLLDATEFPRQKICGEHLSATTLPLLDRLGVRETIEREAIPVRSHAIVLPGGRRLSVRFAPHGAPAIAISRYRLDQLLVERAANAGAIVIESHRVREVIVEHGAVCGVIAHRTGLRSQSKTFRAHLTIAADGRRSIVARRVGNSMRYGRALIGFNRHFRSDGQLLHAVTVPGALTMFSLPGGYIGASIVEDGSLNLCGVVPAKLVRSGGRSIHDTLYGWARSHRELQSVLEHDEPGGWLTMADVSTQWSTPAKPGVLFIGDALATIDP